MKKRTHYFINSCLLMLCSISVPGFIKAQNQMPSIEQVRNMIEGDVYALKIESPAIFKVEERSVWTGIDSIKIRIYFPDNKKNHRVIYNIHGGALVACDLNTHDNISRILANSTESVVVAIDYKKAPEFPYPTSIQHCEYVLQWIKNNAASFNGDAANIILTGDSGGGLFITSLAVKLQKNVGVKKIVLINPAVDLRNYEAGPYALVCDWYLNKKDPNDSLVSPIIATNFSYFPPTLIITAEKDFLKQQGQDFFSKLVRDNVDAELIDIPNEDHLGAYWAAGHPSAKQAIAATIQFILKKN